MVYGLTCLAIVLQYVSPIKFETGLRPHSAGIPYTLLLRTEAIGFPTFGLLRYRDLVSSLSTGVDAILQDISGSIELKAPFN